MKRIYKKVIFLLVGIYIVFTLVNQQKALSQYTQETQEIAKKIDVEQQNKENLVAEKENVNSLEFIEQTAREKLDMYYPHERVYEDQGM